MATSSLGRLAGKIALITGGTSGIGFATARRFVAEGARVFITGREPSKTAEAALRLGDGVVGLAADIAQVEELDRLFATIAKDAGRLDILFANAGAGGFSPLDKVTEEDFDRTFDTNVKGTLFTVQKALPLLPPGASVILTGSMVSLKGVEAFGVYAATKAAIRSFARTWCVEFKERGIRVNVISPGKIVTERYRTELGFSDEKIEEFKRQNSLATPLGRTGSPEEIAAAVLFLASDESSFITGIELFVDGGLAQI